MKKTLLIMVLLSAILYCGSIHCQAAVDSGTCGAHGNNVTWTLEENGNLKICGSGAMKDFDFGTGAPWMDNNTLIKSVSIEEGITRIENYAFSECTQFKDINIPESVTSIGDSAFFYCLGLTDIQLPERIDTIEYGAFQHCEKISHIYLPAGMTEIGEMGFAYCIRLSGIDIPDSVTSIGDNAFTGCRALTEMTVPVNVAEIGNNAFTQCEKLQRVFLPDGIVSIGLRPFDETTVLFAARGSLTAQALGKVGFGFRAPGEKYDLMYCYTDDKTEPADVKIVKTDVDTEYLVVPEDVSIIGENAFEGCVQLSGIVLPNGLKGIEEGAFSGCSSLLSIDIPEHVAAIGDRAFSECTSLEKVLFRGDTITISEAGFPDRPEIYCYEYTDADYWAMDRENPIVYLDGKDSNQIRSIILKDSFKLRVGETEGILADVFPIRSDESVSWSSSNPFVVSVQSGIVTANHVGKARVTASIGGVSASVEITVYTFAEDFYTEEEIWMVTKTNYQLQALNIVPEGAETDLSWSSSNELVASVNKDGLVTGKKPGDAVITAADVSGTVRTTTVHVYYPVTNITFEEAEPMCVGQTQQLTAHVTARTQTCINHFVVFSSENDHIASVNSDGLVSAVSPGTVEIIAAAQNGVSAVCSVVVECSAVLELPGKLTVLGDEAFAGVSGAEGIRVPGTVKMIADTAFKDSNLVILAPAGSYALQWAKEQGYPYIEE